MNFSLTDAQRDLQDRARRFVEQEVLPFYKSWPITTYEYSDELKERLRSRMRDYGLLNLFTPKQFGGEGLGAMEDVIVLTEIAKSPRRMPIPHFPPWPVMYEASEYIQSKYLYPVLEGKTGWSMCFTEPEAGSDLAGIKTTAVRDGDNWVINGRKIWRTGHHAASYTAVAAVTDASKGHKGISIFLIDNDTPGLVVTNEFPVISRTWGDEQELELRNVIVPAKNLLGGEGLGFEIAQVQFNRFRLRLGGLALGMAERSHEIALDYARNRMVFGKPLIDNQAIQLMLTDNKFDIESIRLNTYHAAWMVDSGDPSLSSRLHASMVKGYCIDAGLRVIDRCMQILGGRGVMIDEYPFFDYYNNLRMCKLMEGSTEVMKIVMTREMLKGH